MKKSILIVDDMRSALLMMHISLKKKYDVLMADTATEAIRIFSMINVACIVIDINLSANISDAGIELMSNLIRSGYSGKIVLMSGYSHKAIDPEVLALADHFMEKPFVISELIEWLDKNIGEK